MFTTAGPPWDPRRGDPVAWLPGDGYLRAMTRWLLKTEPSTYSWDDLAREGRTAWTGVANPQAQANLRSMRRGDAAVVYHTGAQKAAVGLAENYQRLITIGSVAANDADFVALRNQIKDILTAHPLIKTKLIRSI